MALQPPLEVDERQHLRHAEGRSLPLPEPLVLRAAQRLQTAMSSFSGAGGLQIGLSNGDARQVVSRPGYATAEATVELSARSYLRLEQGLIEPRTALVFGEVKIGGAVSLATRFLDHVAGRVSTGAPAATNLPRPTRDIAQCHSDLREYGYCILLDALAPDQVERLRARLVEQADAERRLGLATMEGGIGNPNQRVWNLINKGEEFIELLDNDAIDEFALPILGDHFLISTFQANITGPGCDAQILHYDQMSVQPNIIGMTMGLNFGWYLDDVTERNGATRLVPCSNRDGVALDDPFDLAPTVPAEAPAGSVLIWDSRVWHGAGANVATAKRHVILLYVIRYFLRTQENFGLSLRPDLRDRLSDRVLTMLGYRCTVGLGGVEGPVEQSMVRMPKTHVGILGTQVPSTPVVA